MVKSALWATCLCMGIAVVVGSAGADEVHLKSGEVIEGELVRETKDEVIIRVKRGSLSVEMTYRRNEIAKLVRKLAPADEYQEKVHDTPATAAAQYALARWCREKGLDAEALVHAKRAVEIDKTHHKARALLLELGYVEIDGAWVRESEHLAAKGLVRVGDKIVPVAEAEKAKELSFALVARTTAAQKVKEHEGKLRKIEAEIARRSARVGELANEQVGLEAAYRDLLARLESSKDRLVQLKAKLDAAVARVLQEKEVYGQATQGSLYAEDAARSDYNAEVVQHDRIVAAINSVIARSKAVANEGGEHERELKRLEAKRIDEKAKLAGAETELAQAERRIAIARGERAADSSASPPQPLEKEPLSTPLTESDLKATVVLVYVEGRCTGSGFFVSSEGHLVTNAHVIEGGDAPIYALWDGSVGRRAERMREVARAGGEDLVLLAPEGKGGGGYRWLPIRERYELGTPVMLAGFPLATKIADTYGTSPTDLAVSRGVLGAVRRENDIPRWIQTDCKAASGSSGGPLIDLRTGAVIGILTEVVTPGKRDAGDVIQMALPSRLVLEHFGRYLPK